MQLPQTKEKPKEPEKRLTREQRRRQERLNQEISSVFEQLTGKFVSFFLDCENPDGEQVEERMKQMDAQWRVYCKRKNVLPKGYTLFREWCEQYLKDYKAEKASLDSL